jgi:hypothetical protein
MVDPGGELELGRLEWVVSWEVEVEEENTSNVLPIQACQVPVHHQDLPSKHQLKWFRLLGYLEGAMVTSIDHLKGSPLTQFPFD